MLECKQKPNKIISNTVLDENNTSHIAKMVNCILEDEFPALKNNSLLFNLVTVSQALKLNTVQNKKNSLLYTKMTDEKENLYTSFRKERYL